MLVKFISRLFNISFLGLCTFKETEAQMIKQKLYRCATCHMTGKLSTGDKYCICEICINSCHAGHDTTFIDQFNFHGFCDCGDEGSRGIRSCKMLKGTVPTGLQKVYLVKDYYIDRQNTQPEHSGGGKQSPKITLPGWIFWTMIFHNLKKFTSRSN